VITNDEIERRIEETDAPRSARRSAAAKQVSELARRHTELTEQVSDLERQLGDVLIEAQDVIEVEELAQFTEVPASNLAQWLTARTSAKARPKRKRSAGAPTATDGDSNRERSTAGTPASSPAVPSESRGPRPDTAGRVLAQLP
jgi:hypothetical protein